MKVRDPLYGQEYKFPIYTVIINGQEQEFAAGEFSNCVWGFYLLKYFIVVAAISLLIFFADVPFGFTPKLFWRCPCCGHPFPYYVPIRRNNLKEKECLRNIEGRHIKYVKLKFCPLIIPSVCPECKCKFFEMADNLQNAGKN